MTLEEKKQKKIKTIKWLRRFQCINGLLCVASVLPFFHMTSCLGQKKEVPLISKVGFVSFCASAIAGATSRKKEEKAEKELIQILEKQKERGY